MLAVVTPRKDLEGLAREASRVRDVHDKKTGQDMATARTLEGQATISRPAQLVELPETVADVVDGATDVATLRVAGFPPLAGPGDDRLQGSQGLARGRRAARADPRGGRLFNQPYDPAQR